MSFHDREPIACSWRLKHNDPERADYSHPSVFSSLISGKLARSMMQTGYTDAIANFLIGWDIMEQRVRCPAGPSCDAGHSAGAHFADGCCPARLATSRARNANR